RWGPQLHFVYLVASDFPDERLDEFGVLHDSVLAQNTWFRKQSGGLEWRLDTFAFSWDDPATPESDPVEVEAVDVTFLRAKRPSSELGNLNAIIDELGVNGLNQPNKRYFTYAAVDNGGVCGIARAPILPGGEPVNPDTQSDGKYSVGYLFGAAGCHGHEFAPGPNTPSYVEATAQHEIVHNDAMVSPWAPHTCHLDLGLGLGHVCTSGVALTGLDPERFDLMFPFAGLPLGEKSLDLGNDDYFAHPFTWRDLDQSKYLERQANPITT
ncbi:MAG TPA: hypothetical protein VG602_02955, partial [Actinomycetota bacterium]|nr:hypothetical protein [Actinomycetota bacterium]